MSNVGEDRNEENQEDPGQEAPVTSKRPTKEDLKEAAAAARDAVIEAEHAAHNAGVVVDTMLAALETGPTRVQTQVEAASDPDDPEPDGIEALASARPGQVGTGPAAQATGHGLMRMGPRQSGRPAFEQFMAALQEPLRRAGQRVRVTEIAGWVKLEGQQGHKVYIAKTVTGVSRVESTLGPELIEGAQSPDPGSRRNGRIASWLPASPEAVGSAIELLAKLDEPIAAPLRRTPTPTRR